MRGAIRYDRPLIWTVLLLVLVGMMTVYTASIYVSSIKLGGENVMMQRQTIRLLVGFAAMGAFAFVDYTWYRRFAKPAMLISLLLLVLTLTSGKTIKGATSTLLIIQTGEVAKLVLVLYLADVLDRRQKDLGDFAHGLAPRLVLVALTVALIAGQQDYGSALAILILALTMLFLGGAKLSHISALGLAAAPLGFLAYKLVPRIAERVGIWQSTYDLSLAGVNTQGPVYQVYQSLIALGSGGIIGRGLGASRQRAFIPDSHTDFAFSIWGEELGLIGTLILVALFVSLMVRGLKIAARSHDSYGSLLAGGLTMMIVIYAAINIAVVTASMPTTGLPLPFVSYGGTSLVVNMAAAGILINMSRRRVFETVGAQSRESRRGKRS